PRKRYTAKGLRPIGLHMEEPTPEARDLAERVLKALPATLTDPADRALVRSLRLFLSGDPDDERVGWDALCRRFEPEANVSGGPGYAVPVPLDPGPVVRGLRAKLRELGG